jgi:uncharacterized protein YcaQ
MLTIDIDTAPRFIMGKQGLWPGRCRRGIKGTEQAMRAMQYLQFDPVQIISRGHDIKLQPRSTINHQDRERNIDMSTDSERQPPQPIRSLKQFDILIGDKVFVQVGQRFYIEKKIGGKT